MRFFLHTFQLFGYKSRPFRNWLLAHIRDAVFRSSHIAGLAILTLGHTTPLPDWSLFFMWSIAFASSRRYRRDRPKKKLVWTPRMKRLSVSTALLLLFFPVWFLPDTVSSMDWLIALWMADLLVPLLVLAGAAINHPVEQRIHEGFKSRARRRLAERPDLTTVAITGSYGKTSVKFAVHEILSQRYPVLSTPGSFNTPMGICRVLNNELTDEHRYVVLEMGIRHSGDIAELCEIAKPDIAVITCVGVAHLESMGSIEAIAAEKGSLLSYLGRDATAILNADDERVLGMREGLKCNVLTVSTRSRADIRASDIEYGPQGARFRVVTADASALFTTRLLGQHNVLNILLAVAVGMAAGLTLRQMKRAIERLDPIEHRLALRHQGGLVIIDDAFNSNPVGAANATEVLGQFRGGTRVIVTPGMIELGDSEEALNKQFGKQIAANVDHAVLVGPIRTAPIAAGLREEGFPESRIHIVKSLYEAQDWIAATLLPGDIVLFENDLPDQFNEA